MYICLLKCKYSKYTCIFAKCNKYSIVPALLLARVRAIRLVEGYRSSAEYIGLYLNKDFFTNYRQRRFGRYTGGKYPPVDTSDWLPGGVGCRMSVKHVSWFILSLQRYISYIHVLVSCGACVYCIFATTEWLVHGQQSPTDPPTPPVPLPEFESVSGPKKRALIRRSECLVGNQSSNTQLKLYDE